MRADPLIIWSITMRNQHGAEGPDALQVSIKVPIVLHDLEGCSPLQPRHPT
jgi:hypothetical protein